jgi:membrane dipeptidase
MEMQRPVTVDAVVPLVQHPRHLAALRPALKAGGVDCIMPTVASIDDLATITSRLGAWQDFDVNPSDGFRLARTTAEIRSASAEGDIAVTLHAQGLHGIGAEVDILELYALAGVRVAQLTYNYRNLLADGCMEPANAPLSEAGRKVVRKLNQLRIVPDISHTGAASSQEIIELSDGPVIASHSNARVLCDHPRNITDEMIRAVVASGGVIGLCAFPAFIAEASPTVDDLARHAAHIAELVGAESVGMGLDFADEDESDYEFFGYDVRYYPRPPWTWPEGITGHAEVSNLREALGRAGFTGAETDGILGENFMRVFLRAWGS